MKKRILLCLSIVLVAITISCSEDSVKLNESSKSLEGLQKDSWPCPDGYQFVAVKKFKLRLFKAGVAPGEDCTSGFGLCFGFTGEIVFDCVKLQPQPTPIPASTLKYDGIEDEGDMYIQQMDASHVAVCFDKNVVFSASHNPSDFDVFKTNEIVLGNRIQLVEGSYHKQSSNGIIYYVIPFTNVP